MDNVQNCDSYIQYTTLDGFEERTRVIIRILSENFCGGTKENNEY
jgi:hypothetical protein